MAADERQPEGRGALEMAAFVLATSVTTVRGSERPAPWAGEVVELVEARGGGPGEDDDVGTAEGGLGRRGVEVDHAGRRGRRRSAARRRPGRHRPPVAIGGILATGPTSQRPAIEPPIKPNPSIATCMPRVSQPRTYHGSLRVLPSGSALQGENHLPVNARTIRVLLVDDHQLLTDSLARVLAAEPDIDIVGVAATVAEAKQFARQRMDVVLMDYRLPDGTGAEATRAIKLRWPSARVIMLTALGDDATVLESIQAGADGYLTKDHAVDDVVDAVRRRDAGETLLPRSVIIGIAQRVADARERRATPPGSSPSRRASSKSCAPSPRAWPRPTSVRACRSRTTRCAPTCRTS